MLTNFEFQDENKMVDDQDNIDATTNSRQRELEEDVPPSPIWRQDWLQ